MARINVRSGSTVSNTVSAQDTEYVLSGGSAVNQVVSGTRIVSAGGFVSAGSLASGATDTILSGGYLRDVTVGSGATSIFANGADEYVILSGGTVSAYNVPPRLAWGSAGGTFILGSGGSDTGENPKAGSASIIIQSGGILSASRLQSGNTLTVESGGTLSGAKVNSGANVVFSSGAQASATLMGGTVSSYNSPTTVGWSSAGGTLILESGATDNGESPTSGSASIVVMSGATLSTSQLQSGNTLSVSSGGVLSDTTVSSGSVATLSNGATLSGTLTVSGGTATVDAGVGGTVNLAGYDTNLIVTGLSSGGSLTTTISGFNGNSSTDSDGIEIAGLTSSSVTGVTYPDADHVQFTLTNGQTVTLNVIGVQSSGYTLGTASDGNLLYEVCFLAGTLIRTPSGEKSVEQLSINDEAITYDWATKTEKTQKITWVGSKKTTVNPELSDDEAGWPVRVCKNAIAQGIPHKDLLVTSEHCLFFEGVFIPARMLVNNTSIYYDHTIASYHYYHIELENHSVIWSDGMLTESYLDTGNKSQFKQHGDIVRLIAKPRGEAKTSAAPLAVSTEIVEPVFQAIAARSHSTAEFSARSAMSAVTTTTDPDLHLVTDAGLVIKPARQTNEKVVFILPVGTETVYIASRSDRPSDAIGPFIDDRRLLGVLIGDMTLFETTQTIHLTDHLNTTSLEGWNNLETNGTRWTSGHAIVRLGEEPLTGEAVLALNLLGTSTYIVHAETKLSKTA